MQLFVCEADRLFLGERLDAFLTTTTFQVLKKPAQAIRYSGCQNEVAADDLLQQLTLRAAFFVSFSTQLLKEPGVDLGSLLLGDLYAS